MSPNAILQSNLLDIVFENRNKDYGAYSLRKYYSNRLGIALSIMLGFVTIFSLLQYLPNTNVSRVTTPIVFETAANELKKFNGGEKSILFPEKPRNKKVQKRNTGQMPPQITNEKDINKSVAAIDPPSASNLQIAGNERPGLNDGLSFGIFNGDEIEAASKPVPPEKPKSSKLVIFKSPDVMPQYPGGLKELLAFLKRNLNAPHEIEEGKEISVRIKFVVNYNGQLESFNVVESGGVIFDNEVLRVLKKMPHWIPGKSEGENVSVYYTVPVKFKNNF